ncbi:fibronectin type III domain-containing protein [uncultured Nonlabens sp.]|uniref:fibronectin type III domain-containing protein n=1 Tax=uncultured Nonlabens sp. TaxID=859306 RepID=UPI00262CD9F1|nr:fibronectin type III domain-containing protein [uncultured Nonlabens sp.]
MKTKLLLLLMSLITTVSVAQCDYTLELTDNFGSEWDSGDNLNANAGVDVTIAGTTTTYLIMDPAAVSGEPAVENYTITVNDGDAIDIDYRAPFFSGDGSFRFIDSEGIEVYASPANQESMMDIYVDTANCPTCFMVSSLTADNFTAAGAQIGWTATGAETAWEVEYGPVGFVPGSGTIDNATTNPWIINGLSASTSYDVYVRADCGMGDISSNQGPLNFTTTDSCPTPSAFNLISETEDTIQFTWDVNGNLSTNYEIEYGPSPYAQGAGGTSILASSAPFASVNSLASNTSYDFYIKIDCGMGDFSDWAGPFTATTLQSCLDVSAIAFSNIEQNSIDISWSNGGTETEWEIEYTTDLGVNTLVNATSNPFTLTGLSSGTSYDICVTAVCSSTDRSTSVCDSISTPADCGDTIYDTGSSTGNYQNNEDYTITYFPENVGDVVTLNFTSVDLENCCDTLEVFDGVDVTATAFSNDLEEPATFRATNPDGAITIRFNSDVSVTRAGWVAEYTCGAPPSCLEPSDLTVANVTFESAQLSWISGGSGEASWDVEIVLAGTTPTGIPTDVVTTNSYLATGLSIATSYDFYVRADCGTGTSVYIGPLNFATTAACGDMIYDTGALTDNYQNNEDYTITYFPENVGDVVTLNFTSVEVENCCDTLEVFDGVDVTATAFSNDLEDPATFRATNPDGAITIRFSSDGSITRAGWVAEYTCGAPPSCLEPTSVVIDTIDATSASASWSSLSDATVWQVEVQPTTIPQGTTGAIYENLTSTNPQAISGLSPQSTYDLYVRADCGAGDFSSWVGPITFTTLCGVVTQYPYVTDFMMNAPNQCWNEAIDGEIVDGPIGLGTSDWRTGSYENTAGVAVPSNTINLWQNIDREWLISEQFDMSGSSNDVLTVEVAVTNYSFTGVSTATDTDSMGSDDQVDLLITTDSGITWTSLMTWNLANQPDVTGTNLTFDLSSYTGTVQFAFMASDGDIADTEDYDFHVGVFEIDGTAGNNDFEKTEFTIYPNPVSSILYVQTDASLKKLIIYNLMGQIVRSREVENRAEINVQELPSGMYLIEMISDTTTETVRFIKE